MINKRYILKRFKTVLFGWSFWFMFITFSILLGCSESDNLNKDTSKVIAQVGEEKLTVDMLTKVYPNGVDLKAESIRNYVRIWTESEIVIASAKKSLSEKEKDFSKELKNYENSLLKYSYEQKLIDSALVYDVSQSELKKYFEKNKKNFELKENIVRVRYVKVPKKHSKLNNIKYMLQYKDSVRKKRFFKLIQKENIFCIADDSAWVKLEDLKEYPEKTIKALCNWLGIKEVDSLYEMTAQGKKWWGDKASPDYRKEGMNPFGKVSISRKLGSVFSENDQFILRTLFYPFSVRFGYAEENLEQFKKDLKDIRPMLDEMFDFEKKLAQRTNTDTEKFMKSGHYLYLRSGMIERWNTLNKFHTYKNMLTRLKIN